MTGGGVGSTGVTVDVVIVGHDIVVVGPTDEVGVGKSGVGVEGIQVEVNILEAHRNTHVCYFNTVYYM